jgi:hypothetical protein
MEVRDNMSRPPPLRFIAKKNGPSTFKAVDWASPWDGLNTVGMRKISDHAMNQTPANEGAAN